MISNFGWIGLLVGAILAAAVIPNRIAGAIVLALVAGTAFVRLGDVKLRDATGGQLSRAIYLDADRASRELGKLSKERSLWFWYALNLAGDQQYTSVSSNYLWMTSLLGKSMPETKDLRVDVLHPGTFVSLMDDREDVVQQGVSVLKQKGIHLLPVARVRSTARPGVFGIGLFRVARLALPSKIYTSSPPASTLKPIAELIDYDLGGILTHTSRVVYGKKAEQNPPLPAWIIPSTDTRDHCATNFLPLSEKGAAAATAVQVDAVDEPAQYDYGRLNLVLQDQDYKVLYWSGTLDGGEDHSVVALPNGTKAVRIAFLANDEGYIRFVKSVHVRALVRK